MQCSSCTCAPDARRPTTARQRARGGGARRMGVRGQGDARDTPAAATCSGAGRCGTGAAGRCTRGWTPPRRRRPRWRAPP
eukprot:5050689-Prymnesium_polylepis.1